MKTARATGIDFEKRATSPRRKTIRTGIPAVVAVRAKYFHRPFATGEKNVSPPSCPKTHPYTNARAAYRYRIVVGVRACGSFYLRDREETG
jgi:hypothetical protein